ncbi:MAG: efflux RND transporter periplasmic adaptor subunit [Chitinispirillia bacterium]|nr:efflux RND transporter periplasmic adaptor subunit [Chitinispirillia bacterium]
MKRKHKIRLAIFAVVAIAAITAMRMWGAADSKKAAAGGPGGGRGAPVPVEVAEMSVRPMVDIREFTGTVKASYTYVLSAKVGGRLMSINKRIGDTVKANEIIGRIEDIQYRNSRDEARTQVRVSQASLEEAKTQLAHIERELERSRGLVEKGIVSRAELDGLNTQYATQRSRHDLAKAQLEQRQVALSQANTNFEHTQVRAAQGGLIAQRHVDGGTLLSVGSPIVTIVGLDTVFVELAVSERDYQSIKQGKTAVVTTDAIPGRSFDAVVHRVAPFFQAASRTAVAEIALRNDSRLLKPGMFARINIKLNEDESARVVPSAALVEREGRFSVFVVGDSAKVRSVPVEVGINDGRYAQILSPADLDGPIVTLGQHLLRPGSVVNVVGERRSSGDRGKSNAPEQGQGKNQSQGQGERKSR